jgi:hypothetical protein
MKTRSFFWAVTAVVFLISGCGGMVGHHKAADLNNVNKYPLTQGVEKVYKASMENVKEAVRHAVKKTGLDIVEEREVDGSTWYLLGELGYSMQSNGQFVRVLVTKGDGDTTKVLYNSIKRFEVNVTEDLWAIQDKILMSIDDYIEFQ